MQPPISGPFDSDQTSQFAYCFHELESRVSAQHRTMYVSVGFAHSPPAHLPTRPHSTRRGTAGSPPAWHCPDGKPS